MMNGALYISFFQGQLESAMEQVVQLAVQEITKTVGSSLNSMLQETTAKDQDNQRLRLRLQSRQSRCGVENASVSSENKMEGNEASDGTKSQPHTPNQSTEHAVHTNTHWLEQKGRAVGQLKVVMEQVLKFAVCEITKIVEDSFDDLLMEMIKKEKENKELNLRLQSQEMADSGKEGATGADASEKEPGSPSNVGSSEREEEAQESLGSLEFGADALPAKKSTEAATVPEKQTVLSVSQDWVPILDKVFGQKWCSDLWQVKELGGGPGETGPGTGATSFPDPECYLQARVDSPLVSSTLLEDPPGEGNGKLQWLQGDQMEGNLTCSDFKGTPGVSTTGCSSPVVSEGQGRHHSGDDPQLRSPSMLHRLLTLPSQGLSQLLCDESSIDALPAQAEASPDIPELRADASTPAKDPDPPPSEAEEEEEGSAAGNCAPPEPKCRVPAGRKTYPCKQCGKKFSRLPLLKTHQQTHREAAPVSCASCGKRFSQVSRLHAHQRTHVGKKT